MSFRWLGPAFCGVFLVAAIGYAGEAARRGPLDPRGTVHIPIGIANTLDTLKTFVEAEGNFSPGCASYGIYFWVVDPQTGKLVAPTMDGVPCEHGLEGVGLLMPWSAWRAGPVSVRTQVCEVQRRLPPSGFPGDQGTPIFLVAARVQLATDAAAPQKTILYVALRPLGPSGWPVKKLDLASEGDALLVDGQTALVAMTKPTSAGVIESDTAGDLALDGKLPGAKTASSLSGDCSGALRFELSVVPGATSSVEFVCPVLPGRRAVDHQWDGTSKWAQLDEAVPNPERGGRMQPAMGLGYYRRLKVGVLFDEAREYWQDLAGRVTLRLPDKRWAECFAAITGHAAMCMNEGAPDVAVVNYNVFNRDGVYMANIFQKAGRRDLAGEAIDYFLGHPFNGRVEPEADNPGQILWLLGQHWLFTRDQDWLKRAYPFAKKLAAMITYYRTTPAPHYVDSNSLLFGNEVKLERRKVLKAGACDGFHPEYTEAFDIAGLRAVADLARASYAVSEAETFQKLADELFAQYEERFSGKLAAGYGSYCVLWPCALYPYSSGKAFDTFKAIGAQPSASWRYFPLAKAHQGLLCGDREAASGTLEKHLNEPQMRGWYAFDEGGKSGSGGWRHVRTTWNGDVAMPHGWAIAEMQLLLRDSLVHEDGKRLVLLAGVPAEWFTRPEGMSVERLPTHFGSCSFVYAVAGRTGTLTFTGKAEPPEGFRLALPKSLTAEITLDGVKAARGDDGSVGISSKVKTVEMKFAE